MVAHAGPFYATHFSNCKLTARIKNKLMARLYDNIVVPATHWSYPVLGNEYNKENYPTRTTSRHRSLEDVVKGSRGHVASKS